MSKSDISSELAASLVPGELLRSGGAERLTPSFLEQPAPILAPALLGCVLVRQLSDGTVLRCRIVETEAYHGMTDTACHARVGPTERTAVMFGAAGHAYVYLIYGMYHMLNVSSDVLGFPGAVLIRAVEPLEGVACMQQRRGMKGVGLTNGPGKLCRALDIDRSLNGEPLTTSSRLWLASGAPVPREGVATGPRVGIDYAEPEHRALPWRFWIQGSRWVSKG